jgi:hypothetical protein
MSLAGEGTIRFCQYCGARWDQLDLTPRLFNAGVVATVADITILSDLAIERCPKCVPDPQTTNAQDRSGHMARSRQQGIIRD